MHAKKRAAEFTAQYFMRIEDSESHAALAEVLLEAAGELGLRHVACGAHVAPENPPAGAFLFHNYPEAWIERLSAKAYHRIDPVLRHAERTHRPFRWDDDAFLAQISPRQRRILAEARMFHIADGYTVPLRHERRLPASISVTSSSGELNEWTRIAVHLLGVHIYIRASLIAAMHSAPDQSEELSRRERQCLELKAHGATDGEIAARLGISVSTVCRHLEQAKLRLRARSREHAIWRAAETRQIGR